MGDNILLFFFIKKVAFCASLASTTFHTFGGKRASPREKIQHLVMEVELISCFSVTHSSAARLCSVTTLECAEKDFFSQCIYKSMAVG